jgi:Domain of unknown function (DUF3883)
VEDPTGSDWTDTEIDLIVADYFDMRSLDLRGEGFVKAHRNAELQRLTGRSRGSIELKHMNISAVLERLSLPWLRGYAPARNFQNALIDAVERFIGQEQDRVFQIPTAALQVSEVGQLFIGPTPTVSESIVTTNAALERLARKFDPAARDDRNRALGKNGEERVYRSEILRLNALGREDLANKVKWVSQEDGDGAGYDILSYSPTGQQRFLEVKTTAGHQRTPFFLSRNEKDFAEERPDGFRIFRLYEFGKDPKAFVIKPPLENQLILEPANYKASFG